MLSFLDIVDDRGKVNYNGLISMVKTCSEPVFVSQVRHPLLVGKELYDGELKQNAQQGTLKETSTMLFKPVDVEALRSEIKEQQINDSTTSSFSHQQTKPLGTTQQNQGIAKAIYTLRKGPNSEVRTQNIITVGRSFSNDITIADYVVSKHHAQITIFFDKYFITDLSSTNGTKVNQHVITPEEKINIVANSEIAFGRVAFVFVSPQELYKHLKSKFSR